MGGQKILAYALALTPAPDLDPRLGLGAGEETKPKLCGEAGLVQVRGLFRL